MMSRACRNKKPARPGKHSQFSVGLGEPADSRGNSAADRHSHRTKAMRSRRCSSPGSCAVNLPTEIQGVGGGNDAQLALRPIIPQLAQKAQLCLQREWFATDTGLIKRPLRESSSSFDAPRKTARSSNQAWRSRLALEQVAKHDSPEAEELQAPGFGAGGVGRTIRAALRAVYS